MQSFAIHLMNWGSWDVCGISQVLRIGQRCGLSPSGCLSQVVIY